MPGAGKDALTAKQKAFCERLMENGFNRSEAYLYVYDTTPENAKKAY
jgi:hypothetical protein